MRGRGERRRGGATLRFPREERELLRSLRPSCGRCSPTSRRTRRCAASSRLRTPTTTSEREYRVMRDELLAGRLAALRSWRRRSARPPAGGGRQAGSGRSTTSGSSWERGSTSRRPPSRRRRPRRPAGARAVASMAYLSWIPEQAVEALSQLSCRRPGQSSGGRARGRAPGTARAARSRGRARRHAPGSTRPAVPSSIDMQCEWPVPNSMSSGQMFSVRRYQSSCA